MNNDSRLALLNAEERELTRLVAFFRKKTGNGQIDESLADAYQQMLSTCDQLMEQVHVHAENREAINSERAMLSGMIRDNAVCPKCASASMLKLTGEEANEQGWKSNQYKCRKCNISFVWNAPNNPWDMIPYVEAFLTTLDAKCAESGEDSEFAVQNRPAMDQMRASLDKLKPVVAASDENFTHFEAREKEIGEMVKKVKKHLLIEKIRLEE